MFFRVFFLFAVLAMAFANPNPNPKPEPQVLTYGAPALGYAGYSAYPYAAYSAPYAAYPYAYSGYYVR